MNNFRFSLFFYFIQQIRIFNNKIEEMLSENRIKQMINVFSFSFHDKLIERKWFELNINKIIIINLRINNINETIMKIREYFDNSL